MMPQIKNAFLGWQENLYLIKITQTIVDYEPVNVETKILFQGVIQPLNPSQLLIKPLEERSWNWWQIHTFSQIGISNNDKIEFNNKVYKVMATSNYDRNNYYEYHCIEDFIN